MVKASSGLLLILNDPTNVLVPFAVLKKFLSEWEEYFQMAGEEEEVESITSIDHFIAN